MSMPGSYANGFAPRDGQPLYQSLWSGCAAAWAPCLGPSGGTLRDWSGAAINGIASGGPTFGVNGGRYAATLDGTAGKFDLPSSFNVGVPLSISYWVFRTKSGGDQSHIDLEAGANSWTVGNTSGNSLVFQKGGVVFLPSFIPLAASTWVHVVWTVDFDNKPTLWVNGNLVFTSSNTASLTTTSRINAIGAGTFFAFFGGSLDDIRIYRRILRPNEINILKSCRGIAYEIAPRRRSSVQVVTGNRRRRLLIGASS